MSQPKGVVWWIHKVVDGVCTCCGRKERYNWCGPCNHGQHEKHCTCGCCACKSSLNKVKVTSAV